MKHLLFLLTFLLATAAAGQDCFSLTGNNASVFVPAYADTDLRQGDTLVAYGSAGCVGTAVVPAPGEALALTVWGDDEITPEADGLALLEPIRIGLQGMRPGSRITMDDSQPYLSTELVYTPDGLYSIESAIFDTTAQNLLDSLDAEILAIELAWGEASRADSLIIQSLYDNLALAQETNDSLFALVGQLEVENSDLRLQLAESQTRADSLQSELDALQGIESQLAALQAEFDAFKAGVQSALDKLRAIREAIESHPGNKYDDLLIILNSP